MTGIIDSAGIHRDPPGQPSPHRDASRLGVQSQKIPLHVVLYHHSRCVNSRYIVLYPFVKRKMGAYSGLVMPQLKFKLTPV